MGDLLVMNGATALERLRGFERHVSVRIQNINPELHELERQFVEDDMHIQTGPKVGQPVTAKGRRQRPWKPLKWGWELVRDPEALRQRRKQPA